MPQYKDNFIGPANYFRWTNESESIFVCFLNIIWQTSCFIHITGELPTSGMENPSQSDSEIY